MKSIKIIRSVGIALLVVAVVGAGIVLVRSNSETKRTEDKSAENTTSEAALSQSEQADQTETAVMTETAGATELPETTASVSAETEVPAETETSASSNGTGAQGTSELDTSAETVTVVIESGEDSTTVANKLEEAGVIENAEAFNTFLVESEYSRRLIAGTYELTVGESFSSIAKKIAGDSK